jgi:hypothetical protein
MMMNEIVAKIPIGGARQLWVLVREIEKCSDTAHVATNAGWDRWVQDLARIAPEMSISPSGEGPDRHEVSHSSAFVIFRSSARALFRLFGISGSRRAHSSSLKSNRMIHLRPR